MNLKGWPFQSITATIEPNGPPDDGGGGDVPH